MRYLALTLLLGCSAVAPQEPDEEAGPVLAPGVSADAATLAVLSELSPSALPVAPADISNSYADDEAAARLGQRWFFDAGFSGPLLDSDNNGASVTLGAIGDTGRVACQSCHVPEGGFSDTRTYGGQVSLGAGWGVRRAPSLLDVGHAKLLMWDGSRDSLFSQVFGPIESPVEMNSSRLYVAQQIWQRYKADYEAVFGPLPDLSDTERFPPLTAPEAGCDGRPPSAVSCHGMPGDGAEFDGMSGADQDAVTRVVVNFGKALGAYERKLSCGPSRFDAWMHGEASALDALEQRGAVLFAGKARCASCHSGPFMSDQEFHNVGLEPDFVAIIIIDANDHGAVEGVAKALASPVNVQSVYSDGDDGRLPASVLPQWDGAFRTPTLRCVSRRPSFLHTGQFTTLASAVHFFNASPNGVYPGEKEIEKLYLTADEEAELVAFLTALEGPGPEARLLEAEY